MCLLISLLLFSTQSYSFGKLYFLTDIEIDQNNGPFYDYYEHNDSILYLTNKISISSHRIKHMSIDELEDGSFDLIVQFGRYSGLDFSGQADNYKYIGLISDNKIKHLFGYSYHPLTNILQIKGFKNRAITKSIIKKNHPEIIGWEFTDTVKYFSKGGVFPRFILQNNEEYVGDAIEVGAMWHVPSCSYGCGGGGYGPILRYAQGNNTKKLFLGYSMFASLGALDAGLVQYSEKGQKKKTGVQFNGRFSLLVLTLISVDGEASLNIGFGI
jgi:hypothetical protein